MNAWLVVRVGDLTLEHFLRGLPYEENEKN
jgi:hypothetical protein